MEATKILKKEPFTDFNINNWDLINEIAESNLQRLVSIMVGDKPLSTNDNTIEIYSLTYAQTDTMTARWSNLSKMETETFAKIIMGQQPIDSFDTFYIDWHAQGGDKIIEEVAEMSCK